MSSAADVLKTVRGRDVDREFIDQALLDVTQRERTNALPWRGQFTPGLPAALIRALSPQGPVLDPFVGSGTTLGESMRAGLPSVGAEVNPAALSLAHVYEIASLDQQERQLALKHAGRVVHEATMLSSDGLFGEGIQTHQSILAALAKAMDEDASILIIATLMLAMGNSARTTSEKLAKGWAQVKALVHSLPGTQIETRVLPSDARSLPITEATMGMVLTSPPYVNVFNYHQNYRPVMEMLGWDILPAARSEIGSNRKHRGNRFLTVVQYCLDMAETLDEMARVAVPNAPVVFVVGRESRVRGVAFPNGGMLAALVESSPGLVFERWQERSFTSRFGGRIFEEVLTFRRTADPGLIDPNVARETGVEMLRESLNAGSDDVVKGEIQEAIEMAKTVQPSPSLDLKRSATT